MKKFYNLYWTTSIEVCTGKTFRIIKLASLLFIVSVLNVFGSITFLKNSNPNIDKATDPTAIMQQNRVTGTITDKNGAPLSGVSVIITGTTQGTITDASGKYSIDISQGAKSLTFTFIGMQPQEISIGSLSQINAIMAESEIGLNEVVIIGYGTQKKATITGALSSVGGDKIQISPSVNFGNSLAGLVPGLVAVNSSGEPGKDDATLLIRGLNTLGDNSPLIVVDGIPNREMNRLDPAEIESITVLKDASGAIYGTQAANGVILITTKRGSIGKPEITANINQGWSMPTMIPKMANAATYATMVDEIDTYNGYTQDYSPAEIQKFKDGSDPWLYPNTNWFKDVFKSFSKQNYGNISLSGGTEAVKYFVSSGFNFQDGIYKNSGSNYSQGDFRSNIDAKVTENIHLSLDISGRQENRDSPVYTTNQIFSSIISGGAGSGGRPTQLAWFTNNSPNSGFINGMNPVVMGTDIPGYDKSQTYSLLTDVKLLVTIPWVKGLSVTFNGSLDNGIINEKRWVIPYTLYSWDQVTYDASHNPVVVPGSFGIATDPQLTQNTTDTRQVLLNALINYECSIANKHNIKVLVGTERITGDYSNFMAYRRGFVSTAIDELFAGSDVNKDNTGSASHTARLNYFGRLNYDYLQKYLIEFVWRYDGSYIFPQKGRFGFFPGVSAGWRISEEPFWKNNISFINYLKLRGSWGQTGNDRITPYQYLASYGFGDPYVFNESVLMKTLTELRIPNPNVTWEVATQRNIGIDGQILNSKISFSADYFNNLRTGILAYRNASVPASTGLTLPMENIGKVLNRGFEFKVGYNSKINEFTYAVSVNGSWAHNNFFFWYETPGVPDYQKSTGQPIGAGLYYKAIGIFKDQAAIDAYPHWAGARPGDIIFQDTNNDGVIDGKDEIRYDKTLVPTFTGGITIDLGYKNFYASLLFQGASGAVRTYDLGSGKIGNFLASAADGRWTVDNPNATKPRTWNGGGEYWSIVDINGNPNNTYWLVNNDYLRLKNLQIGYNIPKAICEKLHIRALSIYLSGLNLLTLSSSKDFDPETVGNNYPLNKVYNVGVKFSF
jgi:TonB-linked SusC/RagA family outer membrane protein